MRQDSFFALILERYGPDKAEMRAIVRYYLYLLRNYTRKDKTSHQSLYPKTTSSKSSKEEGKTRKTALKVHFNGLVHGLLNN